MRIVALIAACLGLTAIGHAQTAGSFREVFFAKDWGATFWDVTSVDRVGSRREFDFLVFEAEASWDGFRVVRAPTTVLYRLEMDCDWGTVQARPEATEVRPDGRMLAVPAGDLSRQRFAANAFPTIDLLESVCGPPAAGQRSFPTAAEAVASATDRLSPQPMLPPNLITASAPHAPSFAHQTRFGLVRRETDGRTAFLDWGRMIREGDIVTATTLWVLGPGAETRRGLFALRDLRFDCRSRNAALQGEQIWTDKDKTWTDGTDQVSRPVGGSPVLSDLLAAACTGAEPAMTYATPAIAAAVVRAQ